MKSSTSGETRKIEFSGLEERIPPGASYEMAGRICSKIRRDAYAAGEFLEAALAWRAEAECLRRTGRLLEAYSGFERACDLFSRVGDYPQVGLTLWFRSNLKRQIGDLVGCESDLQQALILARLNRHKKLFMHVSAGMAEVARIQGRYSLSLAQHRTVGRLFSQSGDTRGVVWALQGLGQIEKNVGNLRVSYRLFSKSCALAERIGDQRALGWGLRGLGEVLRVAGSGRESKAQLLRSLDLFRSSSCIVGAGFSLRSLGDLAAETSSDKEEAIVYLSAGRDMFVQSSDSRGGAFIAQSLGALYHHLGDRDRSVENSRLALRWFQQKSVGLGLMESGMQLVSCGLNPAHELGTPSTSRTADGSGIALLPELSKVDGILQ